MESPRAGSSEVSGAAHQEKRSLLGVASFVLTCPIRTSGSGQGHPLQESEESDSDYTARNKEEGQDTPGAQAHGQRWAPPVCRCRKTGSLLGSEHFLGQDSSGSSPRGHIHSPGET